MTETARLDGILAKSIDENTRNGMWSSVSEILKQGPSEGVASQTTSLALGYVQSGKTTSITALAAAAADAGYQLIVALLGSTNLLLDQNSSRLEGSLGITTRSDYVWISETNPATEASGKKLRKFVEMGRVCLVPVLKHAGRIRAVAKQLEKIPDDLRVLIIDDEADQASLNTSKDAESRTYSAIRDLRNAVPNHLYVQYTATPYAPLLLDAADLLSPQHVEFLVPGKGYTGGKQFFIDNADRVIRNVPLLDEQASKTPPLQMQKSLFQAVSAFLAGSALLLHHGTASPPISMLVHSTARNDVQARYEFLIRRQLEQWKKSVVAGDITTVPESIIEERQRIVAHGAQDTDDSTFASKLKVVISEAMTWLVNSAADVNKVDWHVSPIHILVGGNKLDRGFTVEGLTVTYMNRPASPQVDTLEQRARAFGYRADLLPYCQFFASKKTIRSLTEVVHTEEDLRARLRDHVESGGSVHTWAAEIGLLLPEGMTPTRSSVTSALSTMKLGWHQMRMPSRLTDDTQHNQALLEQVGLMRARPLSQGRLGFRTIHVDSMKTLEHLLNGWARPSYSPGWLHEELVDAVARRFAHVKRATVMLMEDGGKPRKRRWLDDVGFVNLFQGRDLKPQSNGDFYPGDRFVENVEQEPDQIIVQVHRTQVRGHENEGELLALAIYPGAGLVVRKESDV
ncbi:Z1 domain-containing protein [Microlunatus flavus]|uniref:Z1 domain-containing protein n=1 Tax=Microlunatus flavus TaxID=1036181 RepID=A0A1H9ALC1_9ACTN|nr:Z1 domain-containing protein [Microlunatus flavus]SEP77267.1 Z1 domain-containing protein [Microlunatus flavus]